MGYEMYAVITKRTEEVNASAAVHRRLDALDNITREHHQAFVERMWRLQGNLSKLTREYHVKETFDKPDPQALAILEGDAIREFADKHDDETLFVLVRMEKLGAPMDDKIKGILAHGVRSARDIDDIAAFVLDAGNKLYL